MNDGSAGFDRAAVSPFGSAASEQDIETLRAQLGRVPRGVWGIAARCICGRPLVVVTEPRLPDGTPFPTLFYLTSPEITRGCSTLEAEHLMDDMNQRLAEDPELAAAYARSHQDYLARRALLAEVPEVAGVSAGGMPSRVKCLHALAAHALAAGRGVNPIGDETLDILARRNLWEQGKCTCSLT